MFCSNGGGMSAQGGSSRAPALGGQPSPSIGAYQESHNHQNSLHPNSDNQLFHQQSINNSNYYQQHQNHSNLSYQNTQIGPNQNNGLSNSHQHNAQYNPNSSINSSSGSNNNSGQLQQQQQPQQQSLANSGSVHSNYNVNFTHGNSNNINMVAATGNQQGMEMGFNSQVRN